ncbi:MAG TPA: ABC-2 family transporter protein [Chloroflexota bacterium]|nr:ABC-2 family transporter protein [Chloroflexota bacterium]
MRYARLLGLIFVASLQRELAYRANLAFAGALALVNAAAGAATLAIVYGHTATLAGWHIGEALALLGAYQIVSGLLETFIEPNLAWFGGKVARGELDDVLLRPAPGLLMVSLGSAQPWRLWQAVLGVLTGAVGVAHMAAAPSLIGVLASLVLLMTGVIITWASRIALASLAFWAPGIALDVFFGAVWQLGRYPVSVYHPVVGWLLTYVIPLAFVATMPARALTRGADLTLVGRGLLVAAMAVGAMTVVWRTGLRRYTGATS